MSLLDGKPLERDAALYRALRNRFPRYAHWWPLVADTGASSAVHKAAHGCALPPGYFVDEVRTDDGASITQTLAPRGRVACNPVKGRHFVARDDVSPGSVVTTEASRLHAVLDVSVYAAAACRTAGDARQAFARIARDGTRRCGDERVVGRARDARRQYRAASYAAAHAVVHAAASRFSGDVTATAAPQWAAAAVQTVVAAALNAPDAGNFALPKRGGSTAVWAEPVAGVLDWVGTTTGSDAARGHIATWLSAAGLCENKDRAQRRRDLFADANVVLDGLAPQLQHQRRGSSMPLHVLGTPAGLAAAALHHSGLDTPAALAAFLDVCACNAIEVHVPGVPARVALFDWLRCCEHECRPACAVAFADNPLSHGWLGHVATTYVQRGDPVHGVLLRPVREERKGSKVKPVVADEHFAETRPQNVIDRPALAVVTALRDTARGEPLSIAYVNSLWMTQPERSEVLWQRYMFRCGCAWCVAAPDVARAFRCPTCEQGTGAICPVGDGSKMDLWQCLQCGHRPSPDDINGMLDRERAVARIKADKAAGLAKLVGDDLVHYSHAIVVRKLDAWADAAWQAQDAPLCINILETLIKCCDRCGVGEADRELLAVGAASAIESAAITGSDERAARRARGGEQRDPSKAQYYEFLGKVHHALGNAHSARECYRRALLVRTECGQGLTFWARATRFMVQDKALADLMDSK